MRDLVRVRQVAVKAGRVPKQQLNGFLLRHGIKFSGKGDWKQTHMVWLAGLAMPIPAQQIVLQEYINTIRDCTARIARLTSQIQEVLPSWELAPVVKVLQAMPWCFVTGVGYWRTYQLV